MTAIYKTLRVATPICSQLFLKGLVIATIFFCAPFEVAGATLPTPVLSAQVAFANGLDHRSDASSTPSGTALASVDLTLGDIFEISTGGGAAAAYFGYLGARVDATIANYFGPGDSFMPSGSSNARFKDNLTITTGPASGTLKFSFSLSGFGSSSDVAGVFPNLVFDVESTTDGIFTSSILDINSSSPPNFPSGVYTTSAIQYTLGVPFNITASLGVGLEGGVSTVSGTITAAVLYYDTAALTGVQVFDSFGNPAASFSISSASGTGYPVPEPASTWLATGAFVPLLFLAFRRARGNRLRGLIASVN
jgi:hypothetical protein